MKKTKKQEPKSSSTSKPPQQNVIIQNKEKKSQVFTPEIQEKLNHVKGLLDGPNSEACDTLLKISKLYDSIGNCYWDMKDITYSVFYYLKSLRFVEACGLDDEFQINILVKLSNIYLRIKQPQRCLKYYYAAIKLCKDTDLEFKLKIGLAIVYEELKNLPKVLDVVGECLVEKEVTKNYFVMKQLCEICGNSYMKLSDFRKAMKYYELTLKYSKKLKNKAYANITTNILLVCKKLIQNNKKIDLYCSNIGCKCKNKDIEFKRCTRCESVFYCSVECQKKDWRLHKIICKKKK